MLRVAVIGANGFVGSRLVEQWHLEGRAEIVPVVRRPEAAAPALRFALDCRVADALDERGLACAFAGCHAVVHAAAGGRRLVTQSPARVARAAAEAGARTVIYLSSMAVHGWDARPGTDEATPLPRRHPVPYNRWKTRGERALRRACRETGVRFVILRPGIVYGPRSQWIAGFARAVADGSAYVVSGGRGVCNAIYVDNLVHAIGLALEHEEAAGETFLVADDDALTWRMLYEPVCRALGSSWEAVADLAPRAPRPTRGERVLALSTIQPLESCSAAFPARCAPPSDASPCASRGGASPERSAGARPRDVDPADLRVPVPDGEGAPNARLRPAGRLR